MKEKLSLGFYIGVVGGMAIADAETGSVSWGTVALLFSIMIIPAWLGWKIGAAESVRP
jgi:hypothetical protein